MNLHNAFYDGDCRDVLPRLPADSVNLIVTSPPYADSRKSSYGGVHLDSYVEWFAPIGQELLRVLKDDGSFVLNIKEKVVNGERHTYVLELILVLRKQGWLWTEEYIWHKKNCAPGKWPNRFRDSWERCLHFTKSKRFTMNQDAVMVPTGDWAKSRLKNLSATDKTRDNSGVGSGFGKNVSNWVGRDKAYPTNVLHLATECGNKNHAAAFPRELPRWFIQLFSNPGDLVLDPFAGSGTTLLAARISNARAKYKVDFCPPVLRVWTYKDQDLQFLLSEIQISAPILSQYIWRLKRDLFYVEVPEGVWNMIELAILTYPDEPVLLSQHSLLSAAKRRKPENANVSWIDELEALALCVVAVKSVSESYIDHLGRIVDGRTLPFIELRAFFSQSSLKISLEEDYASHLIKVDLDVLFDLADEDMIVHTCNCYFHQEKMGDEDFLSCLQELLKRFKYAISIEDSVVVQETIVEDRQSIYEDDPKNLCYPAREDGGKFGSLPLYDPHGEESSGEEHDNDPWD